MSEFPRLDAARKQLVEMKRRRFKSAVRQSGAAMSDAIIIRTERIENPSVLDVFAIEAWMLWPHDRDLREQYLAAVNIRFAAGQVDRIPLPVPTPSEVREFAEIVASAPRVSDFTEAAKPAFLHGIIAGHLLRETVARIQGGRGANMAAIKNAVAGRLAREQRLSAKTIDNVVWPRYRGVAPYWAAHIHRRAQSGSLAFPTAARDLGLFLQTADAFRRIGEHARSTPKSPTTLLRPGGTIPLSVSLVMPQIELQFA